MATTPKAAAARNVSAPPTGSAAGYAQPDAEGVSRRGAGGVAETEGAGATGAVEGAGPLGAAVPLADGAGPGPGSDSGTHWYP